MPGKYVFGQANYEIADQPASIAVCDFNGDGIPDVATTSSMDKIISVQLGNPDGMLSTAPSIPVPSQRGGLACGDFNRDGKLDLAMVEDQGALLTYPGNGDGTFGNPTQYSTTDGTQVVAAADLDGDGKLDLIVAGGYPQIEIFYGNGDGTFKPHVDYSIEFNWYSLGPCPIAVGDLNGDGRPDIVVAIGWGVSVLIADKNGGFQNYVRYQTENVNATGVVMTDLNGDHKLDVAVAVNAYYTNPSYVSVMLGVGDGTFLPATTYVTGYYPNSVSAVDFNGDGKPDLVTANFEDGDIGSFSVLMGNGDGSFQPYVKYGTGPGPVLGLGDFNGDGQVDLAIATFNCVYTQCPYGYLTILPGTGNGVFPGTNYPTPSRTTMIATGDFDGDGKPDLAVANRNQVDNKTLSVLLNKGDGTFQPHVDYLSGSWAEGVATGDFNHDGRQDVAVANKNEGTVSVFLANTDGSLQPRVDYATTGNPTSVLAADFNGDGKLDLVTVPSYPAVVSVLSGNGDGTFQAHRDFAATGFRYAAFAGDLNGDGKLDLVLSTQDSDLTTILLGDGNGDFGAPHYCCSPYSWSAGIADFNGDGKLDIASSNGYGEVAISLGNGDGTFQAPVLYPSSGAYYVVAADVDGDGKQDVVAMGGNNISVLYGNGDGTFRTYVNYAQLSGISTGIAVADLAGHGALDLVVANWVPEAGQVSVYLNNPVIALFPSNFTFAPTILGDTSPPQDFLISNPGSAPVKLSNIAITGDFSQSNDCPETLGVGEHCTITATFTPTDLGVRTGSITIQDNALSRTQVIHLSGVSNSVLKLSSTGLEFCRPSGKDLFASGYVIESKQRRRRYQQDSKSQDPIAPTSRRRTTVVTMFPLTVVAC